jgi:hypothetical protein
VTSCCHAWITLPFGFKQESEKGGGHDYLGINQYFEIYPKMNSSAHMNMNNISMWVLEGKPIENKIKVHEGYFLVKIQPPSNYLGFFTFKPKK